jgi:hypothetical protein
MTPRQLSTYRAGFDRLLACAAAPARTKAECADAWLSDMGDLIPKEDHAFTRSLLDYYFDAHLRGAAAKAEALSRGTAAAR